MTFSVYYLNISLCTYDERFISFLTPKKEGGYSNYIAFFHLIESLLCLLCRRVSNRIGIKHNRLCFCVIFTAIELIIMEKEKKRSLSMEEETKSLCIFHNEKSFLFYAVCWRRCSISHFKSLHSVLTKITWSEWGNLFAIYSRIKIFLNF